MSLYSNIVNSDESFHPTGAVYLTFSTVHTGTFCCAPAEHHHSAGLKRQRPRWQPSAGWRLRRVRGGSQRRGADEGGHLPAVLSHRQQRGKLHYWLFHKRVKSVRSGTGVACFNSIILTACLTVLLVFSVSRTLLAATCPRWRGRSLATTLWSTCAVLCPGTTVPLSFPLWPVASTLW